MCALVREYYRQYCFYSVEHFKLFFFIKSNPKSATAVWYSFHTQRESLRLMYSSDSSMMMRWFNRYNYVGSFHQSTKHHVGDVLIIYIYCSDPTCCVTLDVMIT